MAEIPPWLHPVDTTARYVQGLGIGVDIAQRDAALQQQAQQAAAQLAARREEAAIHAAMIQAQSEYRKSYQMQQLRQAEQKLDFTVGKERERLKAIADMDQESQALVASGMKPEDAAVQAGMKHLQKISPTAWASLANRQEEAARKVSAPRVFDLGKGRIVVQSASGTLHPFQDKNADITGLEKLQVQSGNQELVAMNKELDVLRNNYDAKTTSAEDKKRMESLPTEIANTHQRINKILKLNQEEAQPGPVTQPTEVGGNPLTADKAKDFMRQAGGDKEKARALAREAGYTF